MITKARLRVLQALSKARRVEQRQAASLSRVAGFDIRAIYTALGRMAEAGLVFADDKPQPRYWLTHRGKLEMRAAASYYRKVEKKEAEG